MASQSQFIIDYSQCLGQGQHGMVLDCKHPKIKENLCAKILRTDQMDNKLIIRESENLMMLRNVDNPNLVRMYGVIPVPDKKEVQIIMEKCNGGNLKQEIDKRIKENKPYSIKEVINILSQLINGYKSLFEVGIIHRNLKPANILTHNGLIKITDFGLGRVIEDMTKRYPLTKVGTPAYAAPQLYLETTYSSKSDIYSLGIILYQLIFLQLPFKVQNCQELIQFLKSLKYSPFKCEQIKIEGDPHQQEMLRELINQMLQYNEEQRISWEELFKIFEQPSLNIDNQENKLHQINCQQNNDDPIFIQNSDEKPQYFNLEIFIQIADNIPFDKNITKSIRLNHLIKLLSAKGHLAAQLSDIIFQLRQTELKFLNNLNYYLIMTCLIGYQKSIIQNAYGLSHNNLQLICQEYRIIYKNNSINQALQEYSSDYSEFINQIRNQTKSYLGVNISEFQFIVNQLIQTKSEYTYPGKIENLYKLINLKDCTEYKLFGKWFQYFYKNDLRNHFIFDEKKIYQTSFLKLLALTEKFLRIDEEYPFKKYSELDPKKVYLPEQEDQKYIINVIKNYRQQQ